MIEKNALIKVTNRDSGFVGYSIPDLNNLYRKFAPGETKNITFEELEKLSWIQGGKRIIKNYLIIDNEEAVAELLGEVEPEYYYSEEDIKKLAEAKKEQRSERNANYILGAVAIATAIYFLTKNEWLMTGLMAVVAVYLFYKAARNIEPAKIKQKREEASRRQEVENLMETAKDDGAVIIVGRNTIRLWQLEREKYALTFPLGYQPEAPISLMWELDGWGLQPRGWFPSHRMKTQGGWTMLTVAESGATHAVTDNGCCYEDECNFHLRTSPKLHLTYQPRPNIMNDSPKKLEDFI